MDPSLVKRAQQGDREAFAELTRRTGDRLHSLALRIMRDTDRAGDVYQAALIDIWRDLPTLRDPSSYEGWSYRILVRRCQIEMRSERRRRPTRALEPGDATTSDVHAVVGLRDSLERAFAHLSADQRAVLVLVYYRDMAVADVAASLGLSEGTVKSRLHYARRALRAAIEAGDRLPEREGRPA